MFCQTNGDFSSKFPISTIKSLFQIHFTSTIFATIFAEECLKIELLIDTCMYYADEFKNECTVLYVLSIRIKRRSLFRIDIPWVDWVDFIMITFLNEVSLQCNLLHFESEGERSSLPYFKTLITRNLPSLPSKKVKSIQWPMLFDNINGIHCITFSVLQIL